MKVLEVGCGNGYSTAYLRERVAHVDAFDYSEEMIRRAKDRYGERNNRFFLDNVLDPKSLQGPYDAVLCVRVLINLRNFEEQKKAISNLKTFVKPGGLLFLVEGFTNGFAALSGLRHELGLPPLEAAKINFYSHYDSITSCFAPEFAIADSFHLGMYDLLTRVYFPMIVGPSNATHNSVFSQQAAALAKLTNPEGLRPYSRVIGTVFKKRMD
jgi:ubiquinone/menaquinone biosynthesis C-methylase UbiE